VGGGFFEEGPNGRKAIKKKSAPKGAAHKIEIQVAKAKFSTDTVQHNEAGKSRRYCTLHAARFIFFDASSVNKMLQLSCHERRQRRRVTSTVCGKHFCKWNAK